MDIVFKQQSTLSGILGILIILGSIVLLIMPGSAFPTNLIMGGITMLFGVSLVSLGFRKVPDFDSLLSALKIHPRHNRLEIKKIQRKFRWPVRYRTIG